MKILSPSTKERKAEFNTDDLIFRKKSNLSGFFGIEYNSAESLTKTSPEQIVNRILWGRTWINRHDARIARKNYPDFDRYDANKKLAFPLLLQEIVEQWILWYVIHVSLRYINIMNLIMHKPKKYTSLNLQMF